MVDVTEVSALVAAAGVLIGVALTYLEVRNLVKARKTDVAWRIYQSFNSREFLEATYKVWNLEFDDYNDFLKKYGPPFAETPVAISIGIVGNLYEEAGELLHKGLAEYESISNIPANLMWEKMKPVVEGARKQYNFPQLFDKFEYFYNEMKKREHRGVIHG